MLVRYDRGVRIDDLTFDPVGRVSHAFWTHRPAQRPRAQRTMAASALAATWRNALGLPIGRGGVAMGLRLELIASGYGLGGAAVMLARGGERTLFVGPTTEALPARPAESLIVLAPTIPTVAPDWLEQARRVGRRLSIVVPDGGAAQMVSEALGKAGIEHTAPRWMAPCGARPAKIRVTTRARAGDAGDLIEVDARPQASEDWLVGFASRCGVGACLVYGPRAEALAAKLAVAGHAARVLHTPSQLRLKGV